MEIRNIGIFAHVDTGKTTLSERILLHAGVIRQAGSVDAGTAHTDSLPVEKRRGISVKATCVSFQWNSICFNLIDTPGHTDFSAEIERSLWALDGAILLVDAVDGIQPQTEILFHTLCRQNIPLIFFINKIDRDGADIERTLLEIQNKLSPHAIMPDNLEAVTDYVCGEDVKLMEKYLGGEDIGKDELLAVLKQWSKQGKCHPVFCGSALADSGVTELMDAAGDYLPPPQSTGNDLCGIVFACSNDKIMGRGMLVRLFGGHLENRMSLPVATKNSILQDNSEAELKKITQIRDVSGKDLGSLEAGMVGVIYGIGETGIGHVIGNVDKLPRPMIPGLLRTPLIKSQVIPEKPDDMRALRAACETLSMEDPMLQAQYIKSLDQLHIQVMGKVQLEILQEILQTRFNLSATFGDPTVIYKETIAHAARGFIDYTMPKPCWAILEFMLEPAPRGSGISFVSNVPVKDIMARYQHQVAQAIPMSLKQGRLGWEVTDIKITLTGGNHHLEHTHPLDFIVATPMGIHNGLANAGNVLLEPILEASFLLPGDCIGRVIADINTMRGEVLDTDTTGDKVTLKALVPVSSSLDYSTTLARITGGRGAMNVRLHSYRECPMELGATAPRRSADPLDTAKYILVIRNAIEGNLFDIE